MTIVFRVTDGTTTVELSDQADSSLAFIDEYVPDGNYQPDPETGLVTETARVVFKHTSLANVLGETRTLKRLLRQAANWERDRAGARVYVKLQPDGSLTLMRAPLRIPPNAHAVGSVQEDRRDTLRYGIINYRTEADVVLTRGVWEADSETPIPLLNGSVGEKTTNALTLDNTTAGSRYHYAEIAAVDVIGDCAAPLRLEIVNTTAANQTLILYVAHQWRGTPGSIPSILEAESATATGTMTNTPTANADCSGGNYGALSWTGDGYAGIKWALSAAQVAALAGGDVHFLGRFKTLPTGVITAQLELYLPSGTTPIYTQPAEQVATLSTAHYLQDLGALRVPPSLAGVATLGALDLRLSFKKTGGGSLDLDFVACMPCDSFRCLKAIATGAVNTDTIMVDDIAGEQYIQAAGGTRTGQLVSFGSPITVMPGYLQRLYMLSESSAPAMEIARTHTLKAYYRLRRLTL